MPNTLSTTSAAFSGRLLLPAQMSQSLSVTLQHLPELLIHIAQHLSMWQTLATLENLDMSRSHK